jgi:Ser/Thr protein kinase RdoA (MazF antagonist)
MNPAVSPIQSALSSASQMTSTGQSVMGLGVTGQSMPGTGQRERFAAEELVAVLSHYDLGTIDSVAEYPRGSRKAPKVLIESAQGKYLLKRRAHGKDDAFKVAFSHALQLYLAEKTFPVAPLIGTRTENNSMVQWRGGVYELFEFVVGQAYPHTLEATFDAGRVLALFHKLATDFKSEWHPPAGSYHLQPSIEQGAKQISQTLAAGDPQLRQTLDYLGNVYREAGAKAEEVGVSGWPKQYVHADWHPGNMLFRDNRVEAVIDFDSSRLLPRIIDIANGTLQFSIIGGDDDVAHWPDYLDESRFKRFVRGYDEVMLLSEAEVKATPWMMIEALIAEAVLPIALTGTFGRLQGGSFLQMIERKVRWLMQSENQLVSLLEA